MSENKTNDDGVQVFKECPACGKIWRTRDELLSDPEVELVGYQVHFQNLSLGLFMFNHSCRGTFAVYADKFMDMYSGPVFEDRLADGKACPGFCLNKSNLRACPEKCECAFIREVLQIVAGKLKLARKG